MIISKKVFIEIVEADASRSLLMLNDPIVRMCFEKEIENCQELLKIFYSPKIQARATTWTIESRGNYLHRGEFEYIRSVTEAPGYKCVEDFMESKEWKKVLEEAVFKETGERVVIKEANLEKKQKEDQK